MGNGQLGQPEEKSYIGNGQLALAKNNYTSGMASWPQRKQLHIGNGRLAKPPNFIEDQWETAFPLCEQSTKNYTSATDEKSYIGIWPGPSEKIYTSGMASWPWRKKYTSGMDAGWRSEFSMYNSFFASSNKNYTSGMASWAGPKKNHTSGIASWPWRKNYTPGMAGWPSLQIS